MKIQKKKKAAATTIGQGQKGSGLKREEGSRQYEKTVLLAVSGMSPAILTETVWALANPSHGQTKIIPDEVVVITTTKGKIDLERELFSPMARWDNLSVWQAIRRELLGAKYAGEPQLQFKSCCLITTNDPAAGRARELDDIRTPEENAAAAEFILDEVRRLTANDDTRLIASLAGGRKTMGALLHAAMSLLGRQQDRLTHILVNEPFDAPGLSPRFFFPLQPGGDHVLRRPDGSEHRVRNAEAKLDLADVPFAPLNYLFRDHLGRVPGGFANLVRTALGVVEELRQPTTIELDEENWKATFDGVGVELSGRDIPFFSFLCQRVREGKHPYPSHRDAYDDFLDFLIDWMPAHPIVNLQFGATDWRNKEQLPDIDHLRKRVDSLRTRLVDNGLGRLIPRLLPIRGPLGFPPANVRMGPSNIG